MIVVILDAHLLIHMLDFEIVVLDLHAHSTVRKPDPESIQINDSIITAITQTIMTIILSANISSNKNRTLHCKVDTGAGGNSMSLCVLQKCFQATLDVQGCPAIMFPIHTRLIVFSGTPIPQIGAYDSLIEWTSTAHHGIIYCAHSWWHVTDIPISAI